jgi:hypothetical protein
MTKAAKDSQKYSGIQTHTSIVSPEEIGWFEVQSSLVSCTECGVFDRQSVHPAEQVPRPRQAAKPQNQADVSQKPLQVYSEGICTQNSSIGAHSLLVVVFAVSIRRQWAGGASRAADHAL